MGVYDSQGNPHHSASRARLHDEVRGATKKPPSVPKPHPPGVATMPPSKHSIDDHVSTHGPATKVTYHKDNAGHHVSSHHGGDGEEQMHHSLHKTQMAAHEHMGKAMAIPATTEEEPEAAEGGTPDQSEQDDSAGIPGLTQAARVKAFG